MARRVVQLHDAVAGMDVALQARPMVHFFRAGGHLVRWDLTELERDGACRLIVHHSGGTIVEHFPTAALAVRRVEELEDLLVRAGGFADEPSPMGFAS
jgi:hypothetical protein